MKLNLSQQKDLLNVSIEGANKIYILNSKEIKKELKKYLSLNHTILVLNLEGIKFIDTTGFALLLDINQSYKEQGKQLVLSNVSSDVEELLELVQVTSLFEWSPSAKNVVAA
jgi:anti-anti-sigma factor